jgi:hypothetical protein
MDEPERIDGKDLLPFFTLLASLAACTLSTLRMYIDRKGWDIPEIYFVKLLPRAILNSLLQFQDQFVFQQKLKKKAIINYCRKVSGIETTKNNINSTGILWAPTKLIQVNLLAICKIIYQANCFNDLKA